jgi:hypothetical protein
MNTIDTEAWAAIVAEAEQHIAALNTYAHNNDRPDRFLCSVQQLRGGYTLLMTEHRMHEYHTERKAVAWHAETGGVYSARLRQATRKGGQPGVALTPSPKSWQRPLARGAAAFVKAAHLTHYLLILGSSVTVKHNNVVYAYDGTALMTEQIDAAEPFARSHRCDPVVVAHGAALVRQGKPLPSHMTPDCEAAVEALLANERVA